MSAPNYVLSPMSLPNDINRIENLNGVGWWEAPVPPRLHRCWAQTRGWIKFDYVERCPCGAIKMAPSREWWDRNRRRNDGEPTILGNERSRPWWRFWR